MTDWHSEIANLQHLIPSTVVAETFTGTVWPTFSRPALFVCSDGNRYVVKGSHLGKAVVNEQIVASLGRLIDAPIPPTRIVRIPRDLIESDPAIDHFRAGLDTGPDAIAHGNSFQDNCSDRQWGPPNAVPENQERYAAIVILYSWIPANDHQLVYRLSAPEIVYSVDHGHFFLGGPDWTTSTVNNAVLNCWSTPRTTFGVPVHLIQQSLAKLQDVTISNIAEAIAKLPASCGITLEEKVAVAEYLESRRTQLLALPLA